MSKLTIYWLVFNLLSFGILYLVIPKERIKKLFSFGLWLGLLLPAVINWFGINRLGWSMPGDILVLGIPLLSSVSFLPLALGFTHYYPLEKAKEDRLVKIDYILLFSTITTFLQSLQAILGMWQGPYGWNVAYTFIVDALMYIVMTVYFLSTYKAVASS